MTTSDGAAVVVTRGLGRRFGRFWALAHIDLEVEPGEALLLAGANGSGKTTLLRVLAGLLRPSRGGVEIGGHNPFKDRLACRRLVSLVSHDSYLYGSLSAEETARMWARLLGRPSGREDLLPYLREVGLEAHKDTAVSGFSAGMRKRLALLRTRLEEPTVMLLDEPFAALDVDGQALVEGWITSLRDRGATVILATHDLPRGAALCDRAVLLREGQATWSGPAAELPRRFEASR